VNTVERPSASDWKRKLVVTAVVVGGVLLLGLVASATIPRWWAQRIGDQVEGSFASGTTLGLFYGFVFTVIPLLVVWLVFTLFESWTLRALGLLFGAVVAAPNLLTLGIVLGGGAGAHAGDRTLDVEAPFFRGATLIGALAAAALVGAAWYLVSGRRRLGGSAP
jgi:hypothetical protein